MWATSRKLPKIIALRSSYIPCTAWDGKFPKFAKTDRFPIFGISITGHIILKSTEGSREILAESDFSFASVLYKSYLWETVCLARRRPSWWAVVLNTGCAFLRLRVIHTVVFNGSDIGHGRSPWVHSVTINSCKGRCKSSCLWSSSCLWLIWLLVGKGLTSKHAP